MEKEVKVTKEEALENQKYIDMFSSFLKIEFQ